MPSATGPSSNLLDDCQAHHQRMRPLRCCATESSLGIRLIFLPRYQQRLLSFFGTHACMLLARVTSLLTQNNSIEYRLKLLATCVTLLFAPIFDTCVISFPIIANPFFNKCHLSTLISLICLPVRGNYLLSIRLVIFTISFATLTSFN